MQTCRLISSDEVQGGLRHRCELNLQRYENWSKLQEIWTSGHIFQINVGDACQRI